jgi:heterodisulfide reductase subunit A-like polyferredoxin
MNRRIFLGAAAMFAFGFLKTPEAEEKFTAVVLPDKCVGCRDCYRICPSDAVRINENKAGIITANCTDCRLCFSVCSYGAIRRCEKKE